MSQACSQLTDKLLFQLGETDRQCLWRVRAVGNAGTTAPAPDCGLADAQLSRQFCDRPFAALNVTADLRCGRGVGVRAQLHDARRSRIYEMPRSTPIPSNQSPETKHFRGDERRLKRSLRLRWEGAVDVEPKRHAAGELALRIGREGMESRSLDIAEHALDRILPQVASTAEELERGFDGGERRSRDVGPSKEHA